MKSMNAKRYPGQIAGVGPCPECGKERYETKRMAKTKARQLYPGEHLAAYTCGDYWHIGHLDYPIMRGLRERNV